ncbi:MAG TPA: energy transducer TonB [Candidatus Binataceae bacterium]|nr:energy transducer TonB [Candidatus Binataceae bacterium]
MSEVLDDYQIDPEWRLAESRPESRSRGLSPYALGGSIAIHLMLAGLLLIALVHVGAPRPSHPAYLMARIVDRLPGADGGTASSRANPVVAQHAGAPAIAAASSRDRKPAAHRLHRIRSWVEKRLAAAKIDAHRHRHDAEAPIKARTAASSEVASIPAKPALPIAAPRTAATGGSAGPAGIEASSAPGARAGAGGSGGSRDAHAAYGAAPAPEYPIEARRMEQQGVVMLRVLVSADGATTRVEIAHSSGFQLLDDEALETVRERWRFVPAMRNGTAVASWVMVPIRFALTEADASD